MKNVLLTFLISVVAFLSPIQGSLIAVGGFIFADLLVARYRCYRKGVKWTSRKMFSGFVIKTIVYQASVILFFVLDYAIINEFIKAIFPFDYLLTKLLALMLIHIELKSIDESIEVLTGKGIFVRFFDMLQTAKNVKNKIKEVNDDKQ